MEYTTLDKICENLDCQRKPITGSDRVSGNIPYYGASGIVDYVQDYIFDEKLLLVSEDGANLLARNTPIAFSVEGKTWINNHAHVLRFADDTLQRYVELYLNSISLEPYITGSAQPKLNQKMLNEIPIPLVDKETMELAVSAAELVKQLISNQKKELDELDNLIKARFVELFGECSYYEKMEDADIIISDGNYSSKYPTADEFVSDGVPFIRASNMIDNTICDKEMYFISEEKHAELLKGHVKPYDVLIATRGAGIGKIAVVPECHDDSNINAQIVLLRCNQEEYNPLYLSWYMKLQSTQMKIQGLVSGSAQPQLPIKRLIQLELLKPEIGKQQAFADFVVQVDKSKVAVQKALDEAQLLFDSLMQKYFG